MKANVRIPTKQYLDAMYVRITLPFHCRMVHLMLQNIHPQVVAICLVACQLARATWSRNIRQAAGLYVAIRPCTLRRAGHSAPLS